VDSDVDHIICDNSEADPPLHTLSALVSRPIQSMPPFEHADAAFATGAPLLGFLEPALLLFLLPFLAFGGTAGNSHSFHTEIFGRGLIGAGEETRVGSHQVRNPIQQLLMFFDGRRQ